MDIRKAKKRKSTYVDDYLEWKDPYGYVHPDFNLGFSASYRSSADSPNIQNFPKRQEEGQELRKFIVPSSGNELFSVDYNGNEIRGMACYSKDKELIEWLWRGEDLHRYWAAQIYKKKEKDVTKQERYNGKNCFVFREFYGSYYKPIAFDLGMSESWIRDIEKEFWDLFWRVREWQESCIEEYNRKGFVEMFYGFRRYAPLSRNQLFNSSVQGSSFHLVLEAIVRIGRFLREKKFRSKMIAEIHDNILFDVVPGEEVELVVGVTEIMENPFPEWSKIVPWEVDWEYGSNWRDMRRL